MRDKILIVDDEADIVSMLKDYFEFNGYDTLTALSGPEAIKKAEMQPDIILLDINMPGMDGMEVCMQIRNFVSCPILFLTARIEEGDKIRGFGAGADDYIVKPFSIEELGARVSAHLRRERRQRESPKIRFDDKLAIDYTERSLYYNGKQVPLAKRSLTSSNFYHSMPVRSLARSRFMSLYGIMTARGIPVSLRSISGASARSLRKRI